MDNRKYKWTLKWSGCEHTESLNEAVKYLNTYTMWRHCEAHLINHDEFMLLIKAGEICEPASYWGIAKDEVGLIALSAYNSYSKTWEDINTAKGDFQAGFEAGERKYKLLMAHEEAIEINKLISKWKVEADKPCVNYRSYYNRGWCSDCDNKGNCPPRSKDEIMNKLQKKLKEFGVDQYGNNSR